MKSIANILVNGTFNDSILYNVTRDEENLIKGVPTLVVGWDRTKSMFPNISILDWKIDDDTYWTFGKRERRDRLEEDSVRFRSLATKRLIKKVKYVFFNVLTENSESKKNFMSSLGNPSKKYVYIENNMLYIYDEETSVVHGISLTDIEYEGGNPKIILSLLHRNESVTFITDTNSIPYEVRNILKNNRYIIPYLYSE